MRIWFLWNALCSVAKEAMYPIQHLGSIPFQSDNTGARSESAEQKKGPNPDTKNANSEHWMSLRLQGDNRDIFKNRSFTSILKKTYKNSRVKQTEWKTWTFIRINRFLLNFLRVPVTKRKENGQKRVGIEISISNFLRV